MGDPRAAGARVGALGSIALGKRNRADSCKQWGTVVLSAHMDSLKAPITCRREWSGAGALMCYFV